MREPVIAKFPKAPGLPRNIGAYMKRVDEAYLTDAYHSLSIEGYRVTAELIERVRGGAWNPDTSEEDRQHRNAMAARGYWQAYQAVHKSVDRVLHGENSGQVSDEDHGTWYREMFAPSVTAGLLRPADLAGYRNGQIYIRRSMHVFLNSEAVRDAMPAFFDLLGEKPDAAVRVVLGHFIFVYIHPYMDGNGRMGRFLMNLMLASGGYPWTVIPVADRKTYMEALEQARSSRTFFLLRTSWPASLGRDSRANLCRQCRAIRPHLPLHPLEGRSLMDAVRQIVAKPSTKRRLESREFFFIAPPEYYPAKY